MEKNDAPKKNKKIKGMFDKFVMGALVGGAIGSVVGMAFAPKKGSETRKMVKEKGKKIIQKGKEAGEQAAEKTKDFYEKHEGQIGPLMKGAKRKSGGVLKKLKEKLQKSERKEEESRKIPTES